MDEHITIGDVAPRVQYAADGIQLSFTYPFPIFADADLEVRFDNLLQLSGFIVAGAGVSDGGAVDFFVAPTAGTRVTLRRNLLVARTTDFQENGMLRARTLNDELDYQVAALQEAKDKIAAALHLDPSEVGGATTLPLRAVRANSLLGFDSLGDVAIFDRAEGTIGVPFPGSVPRTVEDKLAERLSARDFGATGDGATDDGPALQAALNAAASSGKTLEIGEGTFRTTMPLTLLGAAAGLRMRGTILYAGPSGVAALTLGDGGTARNQRKEYRGLSVVRAMLSDWSNEGDVGIRIRNIDACLVEVRQADGFTIGVQLVSDEQGCEDSELYYGRLIDNRIALDLRTLTEDAWMNSLRHYGGHFACKLATNPTQARFGVRFSAAPGAYDRHNAHLFVSPAFELQRHGTPGTVDAIPFLLDVADGRGLHVVGARMEACSPFVARVTGGFNDAVFEVNYVGTYGWTGAGIDYAASATRAGCTVIPRHQSAAAIGTPRLVAAAESVRARAFRWSAAELGFEGMAMLSSNPNGAPTGLNSLCFPGLSLLTLNADTVTVPTSRALAFVVDAERCREFFLAAEGSELRPVAVQFDGAETVLGNAAPALFSNMNIIWSGAPSYWWEGNADLDTLIGGVALNRLQRITLHPSCRYAVIGVRGGSAAATLRSLRLFCAGHQAPPVLAGGTRRWGSRELRNSVAWTVPSLAQGMAANLDVTLSDVAQGDFLSVGFAKDSGFQNGSVTFHAAVAGSGTVRVTARNDRIDPGNTTIGSGTALVRAVKALA